MDMPAFVYHQRDHSRYIPLPSPAPPPHPLLPDDPNFLPPNHHQILHHIPDNAVDFPLPPPPPPSFRHLPMPPSTPPAPPPAYNPAQPQFSWMNHDDYLRIHDDRLRHTDPLWDFARSPSVSSRIPFNGGFRRDSLDLNRSNHECPSRVAVDYRPPIPYSPIDFDRGTYHRGVDHRPVLTNSWPGAEYNDSFQTNPTEELIRGRCDENIYNQDQFKTGTDISFMESRATIVQNRFSRDNELVSGSFDRNRYGSTCEKDYCGIRRSNVLCKKQRWVHGKQSFRNTHNSFLEIGKNERGESNRNDFRTVSGKHGYYRSESGKYYKDPKGSTEGYHEHTSTPKKRIQKKSAFLRIQVPNPSISNRESEQFHDSDYFDSQKSSSFRGKSQVRYLGYRLDEGTKREGSPMELDVSFKSNSLVAKAIVVSSQSGAVSDVDKMRRNEKFTEVKVSNHKFPDSHLTRQKNDIVGTDAFTHLPTYSAGSENKVKESEEKTSFSVDNIASSSTGASLFVSNYSLRKINVESPSQGKVLGKEGKTVVLGKASPIGPMKKKTVLRKEVKKAASCSQTKKSGDEHVQVDFLTNMPPIVAKSDKAIKLLKENTTSSGMDSVHHIVLTASQQEISGSLDNRKADQSLLPIVSEESEAKTPMSEEHTPEDKSDKNSSDSPLNFLIKEGRETDGHLETNSSVIVMPALFNSDKDLKIVNGSNEFDFDGVKPSKFLLCKIEDSLLENVSGGEYKATVSFKGGNSSALLSSKDSNPRSDLVNGSSLASSLDFPMGFDNGVTHQDSSPLFETCFVDEISQHLCSDKVISLPKTDVVGISAAEGKIRNPLVGFSNSEEAGMQIDSLNLKCYNGNQHTKPDSNDCCHLTDIQVHDTLFNCENNGNTRDHGYVDGYSELLGISSQEITSKTRVSGNDGGGEKSMSKMSEIKKCLDSESPSGVNEENINSEDPCIISISENYCPLEHDVSGFGSVVLGANPTTAGDSLIHGYSLLSESPEHKMVHSNVNTKKKEKSPKSEKKRKICVDSLVLCPSVESNLGPTITFTSRSEDPVTSNCVLMEREKVSTSTLDALYAASSMDCSKGVSGMLDVTFMNKSDGKITSFEYGLKHKHRNSSSIKKELIVSQSQSLHPSILGNEQEENGAPIMATDQIDIGRKRKLDVHVSKESVVCNQNAEWRNCPEVPSSQTFNCLHPATDKTSDNAGQDNLHYLQNYMAFSDDRNRCSTANSDIEKMSSMFGAHDLVPLETSNVSGMPKSNFEASLSHINFKIDCADDRKADEKPVVETKLSALTDTSFPQSTTINHKLAYTDVGYNLSARNILPLTLEESKNRVQSEYHFTDLRKKKQMVHFKSQTIPGKSFSTYVGSKRLASAAHSTKPRSWHRNVNSLVPLPGNKSSSSIVPPRGQLLGSNGMLQSTSYIRKGNSLVRKSSTDAPRVWGSHDLSSNSSDQHDCKLDIKASNNVEVTNSPSLLKARGAGTPADKPNSSPPFSDSRLSNHSTSFRDFVPSPCHETELDLLKSNHISDLSRSAVDPLETSSTPENQIVSAVKMENQSQAKDMKSVSSIVKKIVYVKRKSNQLVATSNPCDISTKNMATIHSSYSDGYYKRNKNQLIRAPLECQTKHTLLTTEDISNPGAQNSSGDGDSRSFYERQLCKAKTHRSSKYSLVWTLQSSVAPGNGVGNIQNPKVVPRLFPWKRAYWRTLKSYTPTHKNSSSSIVRKLLLLRNRKVLYKRSNNGFSLRKSKVVSVGRSSLKWSKSIERRSKKASEEATRAVADAERNKREHNRDASVCSEAQDEKSSCPTTLHSKKNAKSIPRRLMIGNDEYVKIGNGNQLVRNPKRRTRILANEKIRWSLHTARQRLAKKRKYCQFFTRFGKCDKDDGKCPYIHDTSKIAVCTKFLNGLCSNPSCKLTHKVIPERMPDCSYFLQGLCSSKNCAYRHVHVNPKATTCEAFLRGYCAHGNECRKKHSYVCPLFEATGTCPEGSRCKLHHPKKQTKGRKRKRSEGKINDQGRYFGSQHIHKAVVVNEKQHPAKSTDHFPEGDLADYISLDVSDDEGVVEMDDPTSGRALFCEDYLSESLLNDPDELIKPVQIMDKNLTTRLSEDYTE